MRRNEILGSDLAFPTLVERSGRGRMPRLGKGDHRYRPRSVRGRLFVESSLVQHRGDARLDTYGVIEDPERDIRLPRETAGIRWGEMEP